MALRRLALLGLRPHRCRRFLRHQRLRDSIQYPAGPARRRMGFRDKAAVPDLPGVLAFGTRRGVRLLLALGKAIHRNGLPGQSELDAGPRWRAARHRLVLDAARRVDVLCDLPRLPVGRPDSKLLVYHRAFRRPRAGRSDMADCTQPGPRPVPVHEHLVARAPVHHVDGHPVSSLV